MVFQFYSVICIAVGSPSDKVWTMTKNFNFWFETAKCIYHHSPKSFGVAIKLSRTKTQKTLMNWIFMRPREMKKCSSRRGGE